VKKILLGIAASVVVVGGLAILNRNSATPRSVANSSSTSISQTSTPLVPARGRIYIQYFVKVPDTIMVIDANGKRTGQDAKTGIIYTEIPNSYYTEQPEADLVIYDPLIEKYVVNIEGRHTGAYSVDLDLFDGYGSLPGYPGSMNGPISTGTIRAGQTITYIQNYDSNNLISSTLQLVRANINP
jgi:hypothetical protein